MASIFSYNLTDENILENIFNNENYLMNHVVMAVDKSFPKHPTDSDVTIIIMRGTLCVLLNDDEPIYATKGNVLQVEKGVPSSLSNNGPDVVELIVLKVK